MTDSLQAPAPVTSAPAPEAAGDVRTSPSVRELLTELAALEDATRPLLGTVAPVADVESPERLAALAREQEIIAELHRRCPDQTAG